MTETVMVLGASGMLGHRLVKWLAPRAPVVAVSRSGTPDAARSGARDARVESLAPETLTRLVDEYRPQTVINAVGVVKQRPEALDAVVTISVNSLLPHQLAAACGDGGARLIHFSTDCVFSGSRGAYDESDLPDARDLYGRSKILGEVSGPGCLTLRTSMIGPELNRRLGLLEWARSQAGRQVQGYRQAVFSGLPTICLAQVVAMLLADYPDMEGLFHVAAEPISKYDLLHLINDRYRLALDIVPTDAPACDRSLDGTSFRERTGFVAEPWPVLVDMMARDEENDGTSN
jgi:dTDP-4-dehydrorhamnose reductase